jgi:isopentenyl diphosphate isomerase/L-lactate dehydrogenase-like FMN-dependent dehydrogenase
VFFCLASASRHTSGQTIAKQVMSEKAWAYYSSAADDEITHRENHAAFHRYAHNLYSTTLAPDADTPIKSVVQTASHA